MLYRKLRKRYLDFQRPQLKQTSLESIETRLRLYVDPFFFRAWLPIKPADLIRFKAYLAEKPISQAYKREIYTNLACMLNFGYRVFGIPNNTKRVANFKRPPKRPMKTYTPEQYSKLRRSIEGEEYRALFDLLFYGGLRRGEAMAITPEDLKADTIEIDKTYTRRKITAPKTAASVRNITLPKDVAEELRRLAEARKITERIFQETSYTTAKRKLDKAAEAANLPRIRIHDLRHSHITNLLFDGFTPQGIAKRVGHSNTETLLNTYAETRSTEDEKISRALEREITRSKKSG